MDDRAYVTTNPRSGKMKHIRNNLQVMLTPSAVGGEPRGESVAGTARIIDHAPECAERALHEKYRLALALFHFFGRREVRRITLEIRAADSESGSW